MNPAESDLSLLNAMIFYRSHRKNALVPFPSNRIVAPVRVGQPRRTFGFAKLHVATDANRADVAFASYGLSPALFRLEPRTIPGVD